MRDHDHGQPALNSRGQNIYPTEEGVENFRHWFAGSKVIDVHGRPLVLFHGTVHDFDTFGGKKEAQGHHFGTPEQASFRLHQEHGLIFITSDWSKGGHTVLPVYLSIKNPKRLKDRTGSWKAAVQRAKDEGHDGIVYLNRGEVPTAPGQPLNTLTQRELNALSDSEFLTRFPQARESWIAFSSEQIKSATGNDGTFCSNDLCVIGQHHPSKQLTTRAQQIAIALRGEPISTSKWTVNAIR